MTNKAGDRHRRPMPEWRQGPVSWASSPQKPLAFIQNIVKPAAFPGERRLHTLSSPYA